MGNSGKLFPAPAMSSGLTDRLWTLDDLFEEVTRHEKRQREIKQYRWLAEKLRR